MSADFSVLTQNRNYRFLFLGQSVSYLGTLVSITAIPYQIYSITHSSAMVGLVSAVELVPMLLAALIGGTLADTLDRRKLLIVCEAIMALGIGVLAVNAFLPEPHVLLIFVVSAVIQAANGFHRPAMDSLGQALLLPSEIASAAALNAFKFGFLSLLGPSLGGILISTLGAPTAYLFDFSSFVFSVLVLWLIRSPQLARETKRLELRKSLIEAFQYAKSRQELLGTYIIDLVAMGLAFPAAIFPALSFDFGQKEKVGLLYTGLTVGTLITPFISKWADGVQKQGQWILAAAATWGLSIACFGACQNFWVAILFLILASLADSISALFRMIIWNKTIPNNIRGRMAGLEMISYMSGPLLGNARAGWVASVTSTHFAVISGGIMCSIAVLFTALFLPKFLKYSAR